jgi:hypothetical protein
MVRFNELLMDPQIKNGGNAVIVFWRLKQTLTQGSIEINIDAIEAGMKS